MLSSFLIKLTPGFYKLLVNQSYHVETIGDDQSSPWETLDKFGGHVFVNSYELFQSTRRGVCGPACAVNLLQGLRAAAGFAPLNKPDDVANELLLAHPNLASGKVNPQELYEGITTLIQKHLEGMEVKLDTTMLDLFIEGRHSWSNVQLISKIDFPNVQLPNQYLTILLMVVLGEKKALDGHFILVRSSNANSILAIDPNYPQKSMQFELKRFLINGLPTLELVPEKDYYLTSRYGEKVRLAVHGILSATATRTWPSWNSR